MLLLENGSATSAEFVWSGGTGVFQVVATFGGGSVSLQYLGPNGSTWVAAGSDTTLAANGGGVFTLPPGKIRAAVATATAVYARAELAKR